MTPLQHIAVRNYAGPALDLELALTVEAIRAELPRFCREWEIPIPGVAYYGADRSTTANPAERAVICVVSSTGDDTAFARHSQVGAQVFGYVDVATCRAGGEPIPRALSHEFWEMGADPDLSQTEPQPDGTAVLKEVVDPVNRMGFNVEAEFMGRTGVVNLANYVTRAWYRGGPGPYDRCGVLEHPLEDGPHGHHQVLRNGVVVLSGSRPSVSGFGRTARRMAAGAGPRLG